MSSSLTPVVKQEGSWWIGWYEEIPGLNCQGRSHEELLENMRSALREATNLNCVASSSVNEAEKKLESVEILRRTLINHLIERGCVIVLEGHRHLWWHHPKTGRQSSVPRYTELNEFLVSRICKQLRIPFL